MPYTVLGKLPTQADFFRHGPVGPAVAESERWLTESYETLRGAGVELGEAPLTVVLAQPGWNEVVVAVAVKSRDSVGRSFPLAVFSTVDASAVAGRGWAIPILFARYFDGLRALLTRAAADGDPQALLNDLSRLPEVGAPLFVHSDALYVELVNGNTVRSFEARIFEHPDQRFYAYRTLRMACEQVRGAFPEQTGIVLGCPIGTEVDVVAWSAIAARILGWSTVVPMVWTMAPQRRLLLSLGRLLPQSLRFLIEPSTDSMRYWPLTTNHSGAIASAKDALLATGTWDVEGERLSSLFERVTSFG